MELPAKQSRKALKRRQFSLVFPMPHLLGALSLPHAARQAFGYPSIPIIPPATISSVDTGLSYSNSGCFEVVCRARNSFREFSFSRFGWRVARHLIDSAQFLGSLKILVPLGK
jgi:hypothetical protein